MQTYFSIKQRAEEKNKQLFQERTRIPLWWRLSFVLSVFFKALWGYPNNFLSKGSHEAVCLCHSDARTPVECRDRGENPAGVCKATLCRYARVSGEKHLLWCLMSWVPSWGPHGLARKKYCRLSSDFSGHSCAHACVHTHTIKKIIVILKL